MQRQQPECKRVRHGSRGHTARGGRTECERRDAKGLYAKARRGELKNFTGIDSIYEPPQSPEIHLRTVDMKPESCVDQVIRLVNKRSGTANESLPTYDLAKIT